MPFAFYDRLGRRDRLTYDRSDAVAEIPLPAPESLAPAVAALRAALVADDRAGAERACNALLAGLVRMLGVAKPAPVRVLARRPSSAYAELHGLYTQDEEGRALIQVWMRTAVNANVVAFRTFLRTLLHELCHHLDFELYGLGNSFHTQGFYRRESSLARQLLAVVGEARRTRRPKPQQAELFPSG